MSNNWKNQSGSGGNVAAVEFVDTSKDVITAMRNLSKKALRAGGKVIRKKLKANGDMSKAMQNHIAASADIPRDTGQPQLKIGFYGWRKVEQKGKKPSRRNPHWQEFGTKAHRITRKNGGKVLGSNGYFFPATVQHPAAPAMHTLRSTVESNIAEIRAAQERYLSQLSDTLDAALLKEDYSEDVDDD